MNKEKKLKCWGICTLVSGILLIIFGISMPFIINAVIPSATKKSAALQPTNEDKWRGIPGKYDVTIMKYFYTFEATN